MASIGRAVGIVEVLGLPPSVVVADAMVKAAPVRLVSLEVNTLGAMTIKVEGDTGAVRAAFDAGVACAEKLACKVGATFVPHYSEGARGIMIDRRPSVSRLLSSRNQLIPTDSLPPDAVRAAGGGALGFIETRGWLGVVTALDVMLKAARVELVAWERIGAQRACVLVRGEVAAVRAAVDAAMREVPRVSTLMSGQVIPRPDPVIMALFAA